MDYSMPGFPVHHQLPEFTQTYVHWVSDAIQPSHPLSSPSPPAFSLSQHQGLFQWVSSLWPKYWSLSFNISPSNEYSGLISFMIDWFDILAVQGTLKSLLQHHSSKASILWCSAFFIVLLSHPYMTTGKTIALTRRTFVGRVMCVTSSWRGFPLIRLGSLTESNLQRPKAFQKAYLSSQSLTSQVTLTLLDQWPLASAVLLCTDGRDLPMGCVSCCTDAHHGRSALFISNVS